MLDIEWIYILLAILLILIIRFIYPLVWVFILKQLGSSLKNYLELNYVYAKSWLGRYIPGKVAYVGGKIYFGIQQGIDKTTVTLGSVLESLIQVFVGFLLGGLIINTLIDKTEILVWSLVGLGVLFLFLYPPFFNKIISLAYKLVKKKKLSKKYSFDFKTLLVSVGLFIFISFFTGIPVFLQIKSLVPDFPFFKNYLFIVGAFSLSGALGMVALIAPSGLGIREGVLTFLFSVFFERELVLVLVVLLRLTGTVVDVLFYIVSRLILAFKDNRLLSKIP